MESPDRAGKADRAVKATVTPTSNAALPPVAATPAAHPPVAVATPTAPDRAPEQNAAGARRFAELLRARRSEAAASPSPSAPRSKAVPTDTAPTADATEASEAPEPTAAPSASTSQRTTATTKANAPAAKQAAARSTVGPEHTERDTGATHDEPEARSTGSTGDRTLALALLAGQPPAPDAAAARGDASDVVARANDDGTIAVGDDSQAAATTVAVGARGKAAVDAADERDLVAARGHVQDNDLHREATFASALRDVLRAAEPSLAHAPRAAESAALPIAATGTAHSPIESRDAAAPPAALALATPIDSPDFAAALGIQVSVLARDGVLHAELHLHPVETGPVSIRIEVDGTNARIDFGADLPATRHAIEQGLPELASALRDAGLTLAGGGVSQHAGSRPRGDDDGGGAAPTQVTTPAIGAAPARSAQRRIAAGGVDVYA